MAQIKITVTGSMATAQVTAPMTCGMVGLQVAFSFDRSWDTLEKTAVFRAGGLTVDRVGITGKTTVPPEIMEKKNCELFVGVYGISADGTLVIPTVWAEAGMIQPGADPSGDESADPTLPVWHTAVKAIGDLSTLATTDKDNLVAAVNETYRKAEQTVGGINDSVLADDRTWSSAKITQVCCPSIEQSGAVVSCEPLRDYPLEVYSRILGDAMSVKLYHGGKNFCPVATAIPAQPSDTARITFSNKFPAGVTLTASADITKYPDDLATYTRMTLAIHYTDGTHKSAACAADPANAECDGITRKKTATVSADANKIISHITLDPFDYSSDKGYRNIKAENIQLEVGSVATAYEPYREVVEYTAEFAELADNGMYNWQTGEYINEYGEMMEIGEPQVIVALPGVNTLYSNTGDTVVYGCADPTAAIEKLTNAILALGGNV